MDIRGEDIKGVRTEERVALGPRGEHAKGVAYIWPSLAMAGKISFEVHSFSVPIDLLVSKRAKTCTRIQAEASLRVSYPNPNPNPKLEG